VPRYYFEIKNGHRLIDPAGLDCKSDSEAMRSAVLIAKQVAKDAPPDQPRHISVLNGDREEVGKSRSQARKNTVAVNKQIGDNARKGAVRKRFAI
jgi:hypothetical protein